jgi:hypothetical protein
LAEKCEPDLILPFRLLEKIRNLSKPIIIFNRSNTICAASVAFIAGYIVKKLNEIFHCDSCLSPILSFSTPGPLLRSINLQNRGGLTYPNYQFVSFFKELADIASTEILSYLAQENICKQLVTILHPHLIRNSLFICNTHKDKIYKVIIELLMKPVLNNSCSQKTDSIKRKSIANKPISRKVLKL